MPLHRSASGIQQSHKLCRRLSRQDRARVVCVCAESVRVSEMQQPCMMNDKQNRTEERTKAHKNTDSAKNISETISNINITTHL